MKTVLITGAGSGFGLEAAMRLAEKGFSVIAAVEIYGQVQPLKRAASARGVHLQVEKLDVTNEGDRSKTLGWNVEILVNNAGVMEGGSVVDIPGANMRNQFEVNVIGPLLLTQGIAKEMAKRKQGRIVWVSSREGLNVNPFTGLYSASKHAVEAIAETKTGSAIKVVRSSVMLDPVDHLRRQFRKRLRGSVIRVVTFHVVASVSLRRARRAHHT
jgi:NAD(P)-dependent dehydrogenase (short-subunit alcohol dehydrogenase family)